MRTLWVVTAVVVFVTSACADKVVLVAGGGDGADGSDATKAKVIQPFAVDFGKIGKREVIYFVEMVGGERLRAIHEDGKLYTVAGTGKKGDSTDDPHGAGPNAEFNGMHNLVVTKDGTKAYLADTFNNRIRACDLQRRYLMKFAGSGKKGFAGDGEVSEKAEFNQTICIALTPDEKTMYVADIGNKRVRAIDMATRTVSTFAGTGKAAVPKDGEPAKDQPLVDPRAVAADDQGNVYILERSGHALRVVDKAGKIRTVAGTGKAGVGGDGGPALKAAMNGPKFVSIDKDGSVLIADTENHQIRRYIPGKETMELVAGTGKKGNHFDTDPKKLEMSRPHGVNVHPRTGDLYIADSDNGLIVKIERK